MKPKYYAYNPKGAAKYAKDKGIGDSAEKRRQSAMVMEADLNDQSKGAVDFLKKKYGTSGWSPEQYGTLNEFQEVSIGDVIGEGSIRDMFPEDVWTRGAKQFLADIWKTRKKSSNIQNRRATAQERLGK